MSDPRLWTFVTFVQSDEKTWPDPKRLTYLHTYLPTYLPTHLPTHLWTSIREHPKGAILETLDCCDIWSEWWEDLTWPQMTYQPLHCELCAAMGAHNCGTWQSWRLVTFETMITILTFENLHSWQFLLPDNKEWQWTAFAILAMFFWRRS